MRALRPLLLLFALLGGPAALAQPVPATAPVDGACTGESCPTDALRAVVDAGLVAGSSGEASAATPATSDDRLTEKQRRVLAHMTATISAKSEEKRAGALARVMGLGYTEADYGTLLEYVRQRVQVVISFHPDKALTQTTSPYYYGATPAATPEYRVPVDRTKHLVDAFLADTHYRNQFETGLTSGSNSAYPGGARDGWEKGLFDGLYQEGEFVASERPKYGSMNAFSDPAANAASNYGSCYFVLTDEARARTTFTAGDSSGISWGGMREGMGTVEHFDAFVANPGFPDEQLRSMIRVAKGEVPSLPSSYPYIEAQIHGPVELARDVKELVAHSRFFGTEYEAKLRELARKNGIAIRWQDGTQFVDDPRPGT